MCFHVDIKYPNRQRAEKPITCYKVLLYNNLRSEYYSFYNLYKYKLNSLYTSFLEEPDREFNRNRIDRLLPPIINRGIHSYSTLDSAKKFIGEDAIFKVSVLVKCTIPEGAEYYYNSGYKEYVSDKIIIGDVMHYKK